MRRVVPFVMVLVVGTILLYTVVNYLPPFGSFPDRPIKLSAKIKDVLSYENTTKENLVKAIGENKVQMFVGDLSESYFSIFHKENDNIGAGYENLARLENTYIITFTPSSIGQRILENAPRETGSANVVTSVVWDYRAYDTMGEATVLFTAVCGVLMLFLATRRGK